MISSLFGYTYSGAIIGCLLLAQIPAAFTFLIITNEIQNMIHNSWGKITIVCAILSFISAILSITYRIPNQNNNKQYNYKKTTEFIIGSKGSKDEREFGDFDQEFR